MVISGLHIYIPIGFAILLAFIGAFLISYTSIPSIVKVANIKKLFDEPGHRKTHKVSIPTLGGIAIFSGFLISGGLFANFVEHKELQYLYIASIVLFFVGIKDDILVIAPLKKLSGEIFAALIIIVLGNFRFTSLHGFMGIHEMNYFVSIALSLFVYIVIINGFNLIDGIDGLASGVGIISGLTFGVWFFLVKDYDYAILSLALVGSLIAFFWYNVYGKNYKIFMGDTGSLILGLSLAVFSTRFN
jgi:UDP-GlcNAc:undecaprenyl-phosphate GlcNAc-1-phosphate transferase